MAPNRRMSGLVPPPPPMSVPPDALAQGLLAPMPMLRMGETAPAPVISAPQPLPAPGSAVPEAMFKQLQDSAAQQSTFADALAQKKFDPMPMPEAPQLSPFEQMLEQGVQDKMRRLITGEETAGERFNKGFDIGQKIAGNILVPLMGTFGNAGTAMGAAEATQALRQQSAEADRARAAEKHARNSTLAQMVSLWENMSPTSSKNLIQLAASRLKVAQQNREMETEQLKNALSARQNATSAIDTVVKAQLVMGKEDWQRQVDQNNSQMRSTELQSTMTDRGQRQDVAKERLKLDQSADKRSEDQLKMSQENGKRDAEKFSYAKEQDKLANTFKASQMRMDATKALLNADRQLSQDIGAVNTFGVPKFGDVLGRALSDPAKVAGLQGLIDQAGFKGVTAQGLLEGMRAKQAVQNAGEKPAGGNILQTIQDGLGSLNSRGKSAATAKIAPEIKSTVSTVIEQYKQQHGKLPTAEELHKLVNGGK